MIFLKEESNFTQFDPLTQTEHRYYGVRQHARGEMSTAKNGH
jgi:hypothetical protein